MIDVRFHPEAQDEYDAALIWYRARSARAARRFEIEIESVLGQIGANPDFFPMYDDEHRFALLRRYPYSIVFQTRHECVYIIAVAHSSRSPGYWEDRE